MEIYPAILLTSQGRGVVQVLGYHAAAWALGDELDESKTVSARKEAQAPSDGGAGNGQGGKDEMGEGCAVGTGTGQRNSASAKSAKGEGNERMTRVNQGMH